MRLNQVLKVGLWSVFFLCFIRPTPVARASYEEDPVKTTQSNTVPVTDELLTREGEPGPASPTFKMSDTSGFLVKKPYEEAEDNMLDDKFEEGSSSAWWDDWFFWEGDDESNPTSEPVDKK